jgi:Fe2+ transport system protein FeoA
MEERTGMAVGKRASGGAVALSMVSEGTRVRLERLSCGRALGMRLAAMGLRTGMVFDVLKSPGWGPFIIGLGTSRLALGRGVLDRIFVKPVEQD